MKSSKAKGFTIVEVLFVLAIGGLILTMVFLAIPAINRWNNNSKRKADVSAILQAVSDYRLQNMGGYPQDKTIGDLGLTSKLTVYSMISIISADTSNMPKYINDTTGVKIYNSARCSNSANPTTSTPLTVSGSRDIVALYALDFGSASGKPMCKEL